MVVKDVMNTNIVTCTPDANLGTVAKLMRDHDCGFVPVVNSHAVVVGVITDRDLGIAVGATTRSAERVAAAEAMSQPVFGCFADENLKTVLVTMSKHRVRRLPVLDKQHGHLEGVLSLDDIVQARQRRGSPTSDDILDAFKGIVTRRPVETVPA